MKGFFRKLDEIDTILARGSSQDSVRRLTSLMSEPASTTYTLGKLDVTWLRALESTGYFRGVSLPSLTREENGLGTWAATMYLKRIAESDGEKPDVARTIQRVISFMPSPRDLQVLRNIVSIATLLPRAVRRDIVPTIQGSLGRNLGIEYAEITSLILVLANEGESASALRLFSSLFSIFPDERESTRRPSYFRRDPLALMDEWHYRQEMGKCAPTLARKLGLSFISVLCNLLSNFTALSSNSLEFQGPGDFSYIWRPAIEEHSQNIHTDARDTLVTTLRDSSELVIASSPDLFYPVVELLERQQWFVFTRVILHLLGSSSAAPIRLIAHYAAHPYMFSEVSVRHEYSVLLKERFPVLPESAKAAVLDMIEEGPDTVSYKRAVTNNRGEEPSPKMIESYTKHWTAEWLSFIHNYLPAELKERYRSLLEEVGEPSHPEFPYHMSGGLGTRVGYPVLAEEDGDVSVGDLVNEIERQTVDIAPLEDPHRSQSLEKLLSFVRVQPDQILDHVAALSRLPVPALADVVTTLSMSIPGKSESVMSAVLALCLALTNRQNDDSHSKRLVSNALASAAEGLVSHAPRPIKPIHLAQLQKICEFLLPEVNFANKQTQPNPTEDFDPLLAAINGTNGRIVGAALAVALLQKQAGEEGGDKPGWILPKLDQLMSTMPPKEVEMPALLGYRFPWIKQISGTWSEKNVGKVFPFSDELRWRWEAAWGTYVSHNRAYDDLLETLKLQYTKAARELPRKHLYKKSRLEPEQSLARHVGAFLWRGKLRVEDDLFQDFMANADRPTIRELIAFVGRGLSEVKEPPAETLQGLRDLAEWILYKWKPRRSKTKQAFRAFGWWFPHETLGDGPWRLQLLEQAARSSQGTENSQAVLTGLKLLATAEPGRVTKCLSLIVQRSTDDADRYWFASESAGILELALAAGNSTVRRQVAEIADYFGAKGHYVEYRRFAKSGSHRGSGSVPPA